jgi:hypothetical protein
MSQSSHKFSNIKNLGARSAGKPAATVPSEMVKNQYVPYEEYDYMKIIDAGSLNCSYGVQASNAFPSKQECMSTAEKEAPAWSHLEEEDRHLN